MPRLRLLSVGLLVFGLILAAPGNLPAQGDIVLTGTVSDSVSGTLLAGVDIYIGEAGFVGSTDSSGGFQITVTDSGPHQLGLSLVGYRPRLFEFTVPAGVEGETPLGELALIPGVSATRRLVGTLTEASRKEEKEPIPAAFVMLNGRMAAVTNPEGRFEKAVDYAVEGINRVSIRRIGYQPADLDVVVPPGNDSIVLNTSLDRLPIQLEEIVVEADRVVLVAGRLAEFYRRRKVGQGRYLTAEEIGKIPAFQTSDLFRRFAGVRVAQNPLDASDNRIVIGRGGSRLCSGTLVYLDGISLPPGWSVDVATQPEQLAGAEIYSGPAQIPPRYNRTGNACGVVLLWTK